MINPSDPSITFPKNVIIKYQDTKLSFGLYIDI